MSNEHFKRNFSSSRNQIENCDKCENKMNNEHLFEYTWKTNNNNNITYEQLLNVTLLSNDYWNKTKESN